MSETSLRRILELWNAPDVESEPPRFGWFSTLLQGYSEPIEIKCDIHLLAGNLGPRFVLKPTDCPLSVEQREGMTLDRIKEIARSSGQHRPKVAERWIYPGNARRS